MGEPAEGRNPFTYQNLLSKGSSRLVAPGLISIPRLDTTLSMHREYKSRVGEDETHTMWDGENVDIAVNWAGIHEELSYAVLVAQAISVEIGKGLDLLGISWRTNDSSADSGLEANAERLAELALDAAATQLVQGAIELAHFFEGLGSNWTFEAQHVYGGSYLDRDETIFNVTIDEMYEWGPELPGITGLRDWYDVHPDLAGYNFDGDALIEDCTTVLEGIVDLILVHEAS